MKDGSSPAISHADGLGQENHWLQLSVAKLVCKKNQKPVCSNAGPGWLGRYAKSRMYSKNSVPRLHCESPGYLILQWLHFLSIQYLNMEGIEVVLNLRSQLGSEFQLLRKLVMPNFLFFFAIFVKQITAVLPLTLLVGCQLRRSQMMTLGCCSQYRKVVKCPNFDHLTVRCCNSHKCEDRSRVNFSVPV